MQATLQPADELFVMPVRISPPPDFRDAVGLEHEFSTRRTDGRVSEVFEEILDGVRVQPLARIGQYDDSFKASCLNDVVASCDEGVVVLTDARQRLDADAIQYLGEVCAAPAVGAARGDVVFETDGVS